MTLASAIAGEWRHIDGVQAVTYRTPAGVEYTAVRARTATRNYSEAMMVGAGAIQRTDAIWTVWQETCPVAVEARGKLRTAAGVTWQILSVEHIDNPVDASANGVWRCVARQEIP